MARRWWESFAGGRIDLATMSSREVVGVVADALRRLVGSDASGRLVEHPEWRLRRFNLAHCFSRSFDHVDPLDPVAVAAEMVWEDLKAATAVVELAQSA